MKIAELERRLIELEEKLAKSEKNSSNLFFRISRSDHRTIFDGLVLVACG